jgi:hypothetical protein
MPIPYSDNVDFTSAVGILRGNSFLNIQLFWHCLKGVRTIKAGTPLHQMILIKDEKTDMNLELINNVDDFLNEKWKNWKEIK